MIQQSGWMLTCASCPKLLHYRAVPGDMHAPAWHLIESAKEIGWVRYGEKDHCPACWQLHPSRKEEKQRMFADSTVQAIMATFDQIDAELQMELMVELAIAAPPAAAPEERKKEEQTMRGDATQQLILTILDEIERDLEMEKAENALVSAAPEECCQAMGEDLNVEEFTRVYATNSRFYWLLNRMAHMHNVKQHDYCGQGHDPLRNLRASEELGIPAWKGTVVRMADKWARVRNFTAQETLAVRDESFTDTLLDLAIYALHAITLFQEVSGLELEGP